MSEPPPPTPATPAPARRWALRKIGSWLAQGWALIILVVMLWAAYEAGDYMIDLVFKPATLPPDMIGWEARIPADSLRPGSTREIGEAAPRAPLRRYHGVDRWFQPDPHNTCTASGCHSPLPHDRRKETRAFANFHVTFLDCGMCHDADAAGIPPAVWVGTATSRPQDPPAILQLMSDLAVHADRLVRDPAAMHPRIVEKLRAALAVGGSDPLLEYCLVQLETSQPGSPLWRQTIAQLVEELPNHARGEYAAKLTRAEPPAGSAGREKRAELTARFLALSPEDPGRKALRDQIHQGIVAEPHGCVKCHSPRPEGMDFESVGYWPARAAALGNLETARMMQRIRGGEPFRMPRILGTEPRPTATAVSP